MFKIPLKITYGIMAALDLSLHYDSAPIQAKVIARRQTIPVRFIEQILHSLKQAGIVDSLRGAQGGYSLAKEPSKVTLADIVEAMNGPLTPFSSTVQVESNGQSHSHIHQETLLSTIWDRVRNAEKEVLTSITLESLAEQFNQIERQEALMYHI